MKVLVDRAQSGILKNQQSLILHTEDLSSTGASNKFRFFWGPIISHEEIYPDI